jgi:hypothetical protein
MEQRACREKSPLWFPLSAHRRSVLHVNPPPPRPAIPLAKCSTDGRSQMMATCRPEELRRRNSLLFRQELSVDLEGRGLASDNSSHTEWGPSIRTSMAELERSCLHLQQEIEGFGSHILGSAASTEPKVRRRLFSDKPYSDKLNPGHHMPRYSTLSALPV